MRNCRRGACRTGGTISRHASRGNGEIVRISGKKKPHEHAIGAAREQDRSYLTYIPLKGNRKISWLVSFQDVKTRTRIRTKKQTVPCSSVENSAVLQRKGFRRWTIRMSSC